MKNIVFLLGAVIVCFNSLSAQTIVYVDSASTGSNDGTSWANAYTDIQPALLSADSTKQLWVAKGTYFPTHDNDRLVYFHLKHKVDMYGGFSGTETDISQRDIAQNPTILSGDIGVVGDSTDNSNHVVVSDFRIWYPIVFDGFIVERGQASISIMGSQSNGGGGMYADESKVTIRNCVFRYNHADGAGGGLYTNYSSMPIIDCYFHDNSTASNGGAVYANNTGGIVRNCLFEYNTAYGPYSNSAGAIVTGGYYVNDCIFRGNHSKTGGGALFLTSGALNNCRFEANHTANYGGAVYAPFGNYHIRGCSFIGNYTSGVNGSGGAFHSDDNPYQSYVENCEFIGNHCQRDGGAMYIYYENMHITNCLFNSNTSGRMGGAFTYVSGTGHLTVTNSTFVDNDADSTGKAIYDYNIWTDMSNVDNCVFSGNGTPEIGQQVNTQKITHVSYSIVQTPDTGVGNIVAVPFFEDALGLDGLAGTEDDNLRLQSSSAGIDQGNPNDTAFYSLPEDLAGNPRIVNGTVDMGAYELGDCPGSVSPAVASGDTLLCGYVYSIDLEAVEPLDGVGSWSVVDGFGRISDPYSASATLQSIYYGTTSIVWKVQNCDMISTDTVWVTRMPIIPNPLIDITGSLQFCTGDSVSLSGDIGYPGYLWNTGDTTNSITVMTTGNYSLMVADTAGCYSNSSTAIHVDAYTPPATPTITFSGDTILCGSETISLHAPSGQSGYQWSTGQTSSTIAVNSTGSYAVRVNNSNGCWSTVSDSVHITQFANPVQPVLSVSDSAVFCNGDSAVVSIDMAAVEYHWSNGSQTPTVTLYGSQNISVYIRDEHGCSSISSTILGVQEVTVSQPMITASGSTDFCLGDSVMLSAPSGFESYSWSNGSTDQSITVMQSGDYHVQVENALGCLSPISSDVSVTANVPPSIPAVNVSGATEFCQGQTVTLSLPSGFSSYHWSNGSAASQIIISGNGNYWAYVVDNNGCTSQHSDTVAVVVHSLPPTPTVSASGTLEFCEGGSVVLSAPNGYSAYQWSNGSTQNSQPVNTSGNHRVRVTNSFGCVSQWSAYVNITVYTPVSAPEITVFPATTICDGDSIVLTASGDLATYYWSNGESSSEIILYASDSLWVYGIDQHGCTTENSEPVVISIIPKPPVPDVTLDNIFEVSTSTVADHYFWLMNDTLLNVSASSFEATSPGIYQLYVETGGCLSGISQSVTVECTSSGTDQFMSISPNPNKGKFVLSVSGYAIEEATLTVYNLLGQQMSPAYSLVATPCTKNDYDMNFGLLDEGIYFMKINVNGTEETLRWVVID